jgi:hypothetical protein
VYRTYGIKTARALLGLDYGTGEATHRCKGKKVKIRKAEEPESTEAMA